MTNIKRCDIVTVDTEILLTLGREDLCGEIFIANCIGEETLDKRYFGLASEDGKIDLIAHESILTKLEEVK